MAGDVDELFTSWMTQLSEADTDVSAYSTLLGKHLHIYMLFAGWEVHMVKNCNRGLENAARGRIFTPEVTVFHHSDRPKPANNVFIFFLQ